MIKRVVFVKLHRKSIVLSRLFFHVAKSRVLSGAMQGCHTPFIQKSRNFALNDQQHTTFRIQDRRYEGIWLFFVPFLVATRED